MNLRFDFMGIIFMVIAIMLGNVLGGYVAGAVGFGSGLVGAFLIGAIIYAVYAFISGAKMSLMNAVIFSILVYVATMITNIVASTLGWSGGIMLVVVEAVVLSFLWGYFGKGKTGLTGSRRRRGRRKRKR